MVSQILSRLVSFFYVIYLAGTLGVLDFGLYSVALAYFAIISSVADFGFNRFLIREVAKDRLKAPALLSNIVMARLTLTAVLFAVFAVLLYILDADKERVSITLLAVLAILPQSAALAFDGIFAALQKLQFSAVAFLLAGLSTALTGWFLVSRGFGPTGAVDALLLGQLIYAMVGLILLIKEEGLLLSGIKVSVIKEAVKGSLPYGLLMILGLLYFRIDAVLLAYIKGNFDTGIYGVAYKFLEAATLIPAGFSLALFPVLARLHEGQTARIKPLYFSALKIMLGAGLATALGYIVLLPEAIKYFLPNYLPAVGAVKILALSIPFMFIHIPGAQILLSTDKYIKPVLILSLLTLSFNLILNLIFIPSFGFIAASWVTAASEAFSFLVFFELIRRKVFK